MNYLFKDITNKMVEEFGKEEAYKELFMIVNKINTMDFKTSDEKEVYKMWYKELPKGLKLPKLNVETPYLIYGDLPYNELTLIETLNDNRENVYAYGIDFYMKTKTQKKNMIKKFFTGEENLLGVKTEIIEEVVETYYENVEIEHNIALLEDGLFHMNTNGLFLWEDIFNKTNRYLKSIDNDKDLKVLILTIVYGGEL